MSPGGRLSEKGTLGQDLRKQLPQEIWGKSIPNRKYEGASRPGNEGAEANLRAEEVGKWGGSGLHLWAPVSLIPGVVETMRALRSAVSWVFCTPNLSLGCCGAEGMLRDLKGGWTSDAEAHWDRGHGYDSE